MHYLPAKIVRRSRDWFYSPDLMIRGRPDHYVLSKRGRAVPACCRGAGVLFLELGSRIVAKNWVGDVEVSTVFLAIDHSFGQTCLPVLWETMVFGKDEEGQRRYCSVEAARIGHEEMLDEVRQRAAADLTVPVEAAVH